MARYTGPSTRISRRFGQYIIGSAKVLERRNFPPGQHGPKSRRKLSEYAVGLAEKQKLRFIYGLLERQFRRTFAIAKRERGVTGERFLQLLETRLDSVVYLLGFAEGGAAAGRRLTHGQPRSPAKAADCAASPAPRGAEAERRAATPPRQLAPRAIEENRARAAPGWPPRNEGALKGTVPRLPTRDEM